MRETDQRLEYWRQWQQAMRIIEAAPPPSERPGTGDERPGGKAVADVTVTGIGKSRYRFVIGEGEIIAVEHSDQTDEPSGHAPATPTLLSKHRWLGPLLDELPAFARALDLTRALFEQGVEDDPQPGHDAPQSVKFLVRSKRGVRTVSIDLDAFVVRGTRETTLSEASASYDPTMVKKLDRFRGVLLPVNDPPPKPGTGPRKYEPPLLLMTIKKEMARLPS